MNSVRNYITGLGRALLGKGAPIGKVLSPNVSDFNPIMWAGRRMTPDQVRQTLEGAIGGNIQDQWSLFDLMEDTWPRLTKNLSEVRRSAARMTYTVQPYTARGEKPTPTAIERAQFAECALQNWRPKPGTLELGFEDALFNGLDALGKGLATLEVTWQQIDEGILPRCAHLIPPSKYGWNAAGTELGLIGATGDTSGATAWQPFPPGQFWVCVWHSRSGAPGQTALLRSLAPYWCGITFGWEWLLNNAQIFGVPFRWATYDANHPELLNTLSTMLENLGSAGWAAFPQGTTMDFKEAVSRATDNPQVLVQELANKYCDQLILGQEASSESKPAGIGSGASNLHGSVRADRLQDAAQWCADLLNYQLVPALLRWNWGDESEPPTIVPELAGETDPKAMAERDLTLSEIAPLPRKWFYQRHAIPEPEGDEPTVGGPSSQSATFPPVGGPSSESAAPGMPSDAGAPETADVMGQPCPDCRDGKNPAEMATKGPGGTQVATDPAKCARLHSPRSAVALAKASGSGRAAALPGGYQTPQATLRALALARGRDFEPLRKAAQPLLASIEAGNLEVVGELEAFIAKLDALAPTMIGASDLADALEAALAEAAIAGAAGTYNKAEKAASTPKITKADPEMPAPGKYQGVWSGYEIALTDAAKAYRLTTDVGNRGTIAVTVTIAADGAATVSTGK